MSEYQYFEFQTIDRPLTADEMTELRRWSSRAEITPTRFWNEYQWGDFKGSPRRWVEQYFDAFLHVANWGTHWLMLRLPVECMSLTDVNDYLLEDGMEGWQTAEHLVLSFRSETEEPDWEEGSAWLSSLIGVRSGLMRGERRSLYLGWLAQLWAEQLDDASTEPPVPPGLGELDATHRALAEFLRIPDDLIVAAAESSAPLQLREIGSAEIAGWVAERSDAEKDALLTELILDDSAHRLARLRQRIDRELNPVDAGEASNVPRTVAELLDRAETLTRERQAREAAAQAAEQARRATEAAAARKRHLHSLRGHEEALWRKVDDLIGHRQAWAYKEAVDHLKDLRDLATADGSLDALTARIQRLREKHARKSTLISRFDEAGLGCVDRRGA
ncbi:hypothetical protein [Thiorhodovibrio frisius]|uniref:Uncharacterized protein n=1 Tax=Thiorhodovibrio frisius TaxID=631362 RepID=H8YW70_9GAMM|nr:hypothetical protein [Thiorhodovibrio frisius]EIC23861.1 hypothetical protein Thi970DRAFT_00376 [Thiorhodovibrio frisius]WPL23229.1 hypothetical protein Thiofri_03414 [Thiorhodovibrio frisius]